MHTDAHIADLRSLSRLLDAALDVGAASMDAWLQALPPADRHLAPRLREMLAGHWSGTASTPMAAFPTCNDCPSEPSPRAGDRVGPFRLLREIGRGGMSRVWLAGPVKGTAQHVALKLSRSAPDGRYAQRLADEGGITALMDHQNIVRLLDTGVDHHQRPYLVLEHVPGLSLRDWCRSTASGVPGLLRVFVQLAQALAHVHGRGVVHRDLKPSNVLVGDDGQVHLIDFGIATRHDFATGMADARMPDAGTAALAQRGMTPAYASPEQLRGDATGFASDVYSLGVLFCELLALVTGATIASPAREASRGHQLKAAAAQQRLPQALAAVWLKSLNPCATQRPTAQHLAHTLAGFAAAGRMPTCRQRRAVVRVAAVCGA